MRVLQLALIAGLLAVLPTSARSDLLWGVNGHPITAYPDIPYPQQLELVKDLGMRSYRVNISVPSQAPLLKKLVAFAKPLGIEILPVFTPALNLKAESTEQLYTRAYKMVVALVSQFKDDIRVWELGNELENFAIIKACEMRDNGEQYNCDWGPAGGVSPLDYYGPRWAKVSAVLKGLSDGTMSVDPTIRKAIGTAGWGHLGAFERMQQDGIKWDITVWHTYGQDLEWALKTLVKYNRPIWVTEFNNPQGSMISDEEQVRGLVKQMKRMRALQQAYNIEAAHIYELLDEPYWAPDYEAYMGLVRVVRNKNSRWEISDRKPAYKAAKELIASKDIVTPAVSTFERPNCDLGKLADTQQRITPELQVDYAYCLILGRSADGGGLASWKASIEKGMRGTQVIMGMLNSDEFSREHMLSKLDNSAFVSLMYRLLLDRDPDGDGMAIYVDQLERGTTGRADIARSIIASGEFRSKHPVPSAWGVTRAPRAQPSGETAENCDLAAFGSASLSAERQAEYAYCLVFGRTADASTLVAWSAALAQGTPPWKMVTALLASSAFDGQYGASALGTSEFITLVYQVLLDREPDGAGLSRYRELIDRGELSRNGLGEALIVSSEFRGKRPHLFSALQTTR